MNLYQAFLRHQLQEEPKNSITILPFVADELPTNAKESIKFQWWPKGLVRFGFNKKTPILFIKK